MISSSAVIHSLRSGPLRLPAASGAGTSDMDIALCPCSTEKPTAPGSDAADASTLPAAAALPCTAAPRPDEGGSTQSCATPASSAVMDTIGGVAAAAAARRRLRHPATRPSRRARRARARRAARPGPSPSPAPCRARAHAGGSSTAGARRRLAPPRPRFA
eukprot:scaffold93144_cov33-Phaeocystis_antarctica.AAC.1